MTTSRTSPASLFITGDGAMIDLSRVIIATWQTTADGKRVIEVFLDGLSSSVRINGEDCCKDFMHSLATWHEVRS